MSKTKDAGCKRDAILVLGMHRSGTSALGGILARLGAAPPRTQLPSADDNIKGFWESAEFLKINEQILASSGSRWNDWGKFNEDWQRSVHAEQFIERLRPVFKSEFGDAPLVFVKDPRICRFAPFWLRALEEFGYRSKVVIPLRSPLEVAGSLAARDGFGKSYALLLWLRHILEAEASTRGVPRAFVHYHRLLQNCRGEIERISRQLGIAWPRWSLTVMSEIETHLTSELRHHHHEGAELGSIGMLGRWVALAAGALNEMVESESSEAIGTLDLIRNEFNVGAEIFGVAARESERRLEGGIAKRDQQITQISAKLEALNETLEQHYKSNIERDSRICELEGMVEARDVELLRSKDEIESRDNELLKSKADIESRDTELLQSKDLIELRDAALKQSMEEIGSLNAELMQSMEEIQMRDASIAELSSELEELRQALQQEKSGKEALNEALTACRKSEAALKEFKMQAEVRLSQGKSIVQDLSKANRELLLKSEQLQRGVRDRCDEIVRLTKLIIKQEREFDLKFRERDALAISQFEQRSEEVRRLQAELAAMRRGLVWRIVSPVRKVRQMIGARDDAVDSMEQLATMVSASGFFDKDWYQQTYADVNDSGMEPVLHFLQFGAAEGRDPGPRFSTKSYLRKNMDVARSGMNPLLHFLKYGQLEGRSPN